MNLLTRYAEKDVRRVIGLMSGTSADGIDAALARVSGSGDTLRAELVAFERRLYAPAVRQALFALFSGEAPVADVCRMSFLLGRLFAEAALRLLERCHLRPGDVDLIASHGQTVCHLPGGDPGATLQIGEPAVIAEMTGVVVAADFRPRDIAAGGQGAPLIPYADYALLRHPRRNRAVQNIGGIANVTFLPAGGGLDDVIAFDTGPGNMLVDAVVAAVTGGEKAFDEDGALSASGQVDGDLLAWLMQHEYLSRRPPKSAGREEFGAELARELLERAPAAGLRGEDLVATTVAFTAESIAAAYRDYLPHSEIDEVILGGGGSYNATLRRMIQERLPGSSVLLHEDVGMDSDAKEALAFAILGNETMLGRPANVPAATGAKRAVILGTIVPGAADIGTENSQEAR